MNEIEQIIYAKNERLKFDGYDENDRITIMRIAISALKRKHNLTRGYVKQLKKLVDIS